MSVWKRIRDAVRSIAKGEPLSAVFETLTKAPEHTVAFTIAVIALAAKMAKADGRVTKAEITAFREIFHIAPEDERDAARLYNIARRDVAGFEAYARQIARMFDDRPQVLRDLLEGLVYIAAADGEYHPDEADFVNRVARIFGISALEVRRIRARHIDDESDPYAVLGIDPEAELPEIRAHYRMLVRDLHPDRMIARGVPKEARRLAEERLASVNRAWEKIQTERRAPVA